MEFQDKVVLITGASSGIGRVAALAFAREGGIVVVADINEEGGNETVTQIMNEGGQSFFIKTDVADYTAVEKMVLETVKQYGRLDIAINNAGIAGNLSKTGDATIENWDKVMSINTSGVFYGMKFQIQQMLKQGGGVILNTSSVAGLRGLPNSLAYTASKHAVIGMTKTAAMEYAKKNIRVNAVCPVFTVTPLFDPKMMDMISEGLSEKLKLGIPMKRFGEAEETANAMLWLCSEKASFVTGHAMPVDGGMMA